jgi:hypothetical protein
MHEFILATALDMFTDASGETTLDEIAATAGVKRSHLAPYVADIEALRRQFTLDKLQYPLPSVERSETRS